MKAPLDYFSQQADLYAKYRPAYPPELYEWLMMYVPDRSLAWDSGTGNGQVAVVLSDYFDRILASDISQKQLDQAPTRANIRYRNMPSEHTDFDSGSVDLITVAQALHWYDHTPFFIEVDRVLKPGGLLAVWGYELARISPEIDPLFDHYYQEIIGPYWAPERKHVEERYARISFPYTRIASPEFSIERTWTLEDFRGYLQTWSALQSYIREHDSNPSEEFVQKIRDRVLWNGNQLVRFPIFVLAGRKP